MDAAVAGALERGRLADITTTGRKSGLARRIEIWFRSIDGRVYITGLPGRRAWYANLLADPSFTLHLKGSVRVDLTARAKPVVDEPTRRAFFSRIGVRGDLERWIADSPLVEVTFDHVPPEQPAG